MVHYVKNNTKSFRGRRFHYPALFGFFKIISGILTELTFIIVVLYKSKIDKVLISFIAVAVISQIDEIIGLTVTRLNSQDPKEFMQQNEIKIRKSKAH